MDDYRCHFLTMLGDVCQNARVGRLAVEVELASGRHVAGIATASSGQRDDSEVDDTGYSVRLRVGDAIVRLDEVVAFTVRSNGS